MGLQKLIEHEKNQIEPMLDEIRDYFSDKKPTVGLIQRHFRFGYRRATRAMNQLETLTNKTKR